MIWVYAVADGREGPVPPERGLAEALLEGVAAGDLLAVVSRHERAPAEPEPDALWAQERVVERLMSGRAVLPVRFGTTHEGAEELRRALLERHDALCAALARVRGRVELAVRAVASEPPPPAETGREWLATRLETSRLAASAHEPLAALAAAERRRPTTAPGEVLRAAYLVERDAVAGFRAAVERVDGDLPGLALLCTGPWPPYSFAEVPEP